MSTKEFTFDLQTLRENRAGRAAPDRELLWIDSEDPDDLYLLCSVGCKDDDLLWAFISLSTGNRYSEPQPGSKFKVPRAFEPVRPSDPDVRVLFKDALDVVLSDVAHNATRVNETRLRVGCTDIPKEDVLQLLREIRKENIWPELGCLSKMFITAADVGRRVRTADGKVGTIVCLNKSSGPYKVGVMFDQGRASYTTQGSFYAGTSSEEDLVAWEE